MAMKLLQGYKPGYPYALDSNIYGNEREVASAPRGESKNLECRKKKVSQIVFGNKRKDINKKEFIAR